MGEDEKSEVRYFHYDVNRAIDVLAAKAGPAVAEGTDAEGAAVRVGRLLAGGIPATVSAEWRNQTERLGLSEVRPNAVQFHQDLKGLYADMPFLARIHDEASVATFLSEAGSTARLGTLEFLALSYYQLYHAQEALLSVVPLSLVRRLMGKFEVFGRIFTAYDKELRKIGDRYDDLALYAFLGLVLIGAYKQTGNLNVLNTALKVNDLLAGAHEMIEGPLLTCAALSALAHGRSCVEALYDAEGFRVPVG